MIDYRTVVKGELAAHELAVTILDENEPLDAQDEQRRDEELAVCSALTCVLRAFEEAEQDALDVMYAEHLRLAGDRTRRERISPC